MSSEPVHQPIPDEDGNFDAPALQALSQVWEDFCEEQAEPDDVLAVIHELGSFASHQIEVLEGQVASGASDPDQPNFSSILDSFEAIVEACQLMLLEFAESLPDGIEEPDSGFFVQGFELVQEATNQMMEVHGETMAEIDAMSEVNCPFCQQLNSRENVKCDKCGRALPRSDHSEAQHLDLVEHQGLEAKPVSDLRNHTPNYLHTVSLLEAWKQGQVSPQDLQQYLDQLEGNFSAHYAETHQHMEMVSRAPTRLQEGLKESVLMTQEGLNKSLSAVEKMRSSFEREDDRYLFFGLEELEEASTVLVEAYRLNKKVLQQGE